jgi:hypothetical protein
LANHPLYECSRLIEEYFPSGYTYYGTKTSLYENSVITTTSHEYAHKLMSNLLISHNNDLIKVIINDGDKTSSYYLPHLDVLENKIHIYNWEIFLDKLDSEGLMNSFINLLVGNYNKGGKFIPPAHYLIECNSNTCKYFYKTTPVGSLLDTTMINNLIYMAGTLAEVGSSILLYLIGRAIKKKMPLLGSFAQAFSLSANLNTIYYPINAVRSYLSGESYYVDWEEIYKHVEIDPTIIVGAISAIYQSVVLGLYLKDRHYNKMKEKVEALDKLIADGIVEKDYVNSVIQKYVNGQPTKLSKIPILSALTNIRNQKIIKELKRYNLLDYDSFKTQKRI